MGIDILHIEDDETYAAHFPHSFSAITNPKKGELFQVTSLRGLIDSVREHPQLSRFIFDGRFPREIGEKPELLVPDAIGLIRGLGNKVRIVIHSGIDEAELKRMIPSELMQDVIVMKKGVFSPYKVLSQVLDS